LFDTCPQSGALRSALALRGQVSNKPKHEGALERGSSNVCNPTDTSRSPIQVGEQPGDPHETHGCVSLNVRNVTVCGPPVGIVGPPCREVSLQANARYLDALAVADDPTRGKQVLQRLNCAKKNVADRSCPVLDPVVRPDATLFRSLMAGEQCLHEFTNRNIRSRLKLTR
jgi:hypothetical protein